MKNIINLLPFEMLDFLGLFAHQIQHPKNFKEFRLLLLISPSCHVFAI